MTTYDITNIVPDLTENKMTVFFQFSNGDVFSNVFPLSTTITKIKQWGQTKCTWFDNRQAELDELQRQLLELNENI